MKKVNLRQLAQEVNQMNITDVEVERIHDIAIIGISIKLPFAEDPNQFWENLKNGKDCIGELPMERKNRADYYLKYTRKTNAAFKYKKGSYLESVDEFDFEYFNISPREASLMDPNQRMFLEIALRAVEDAGYGGDKLKGSKTGVYFGFVSDLAYQRYISDVEPSSLGMSIPGNMASLIPGRVSYTLDLKGPCMLLDTACSSSLVAIHTACHAIQKGDCDLAIVGGSKISLLPVEDDNMLGIESKSYICRAFDEEADGTCMGEGVMALVLKPLSAAIKGRDHIYAIIKGTAVNQDGTSMGITAPNALAQAEVIEAAWQDAGVDPETITYIEAHGTGTRLGDPIEIDGISKAFSKYTAKKQFCAVGSVKTNLGHLDSAAGMVGLIKAVLALEHQQIPPSLHFNKPNPNIDFENSPVYVNSNLIDWEPAGFPRRCGVSAFGLSGTNSHILIEEASPSIYDQLDEDGEQILTLSACDPDALKRLVRSYYEFLNLRFKGRIGDFCYTANTGRGHYRYRLALIGRRLEEFKARLADLNDILVADENKGIYFGDTTVEQRKTGQRSRSGGVGQIVAGSLSDICRSYIQGENIDWEGFYSSVAFRRISIPTYPFEKKQCWLELSKEKNNVKGPTEDNESIAVASDDLLFEEKVVVITGNAAFGYTETERSIGQIWGRVLGYDVMNIDDNFYELGGDSVNAIKITSLINHSLSLNLQVAELLEHQTIKELAAYIEQNTEKMILGEVTEVKEAEDSLPNIKNKIGDISFTRDSEGLNNILASQKMSSGEAPLVTVQKIHFQRNPTVINHWNTAIMLFRKEGFDEKVITKVFTELVKYHDALRIVFKTKENRIVQYTRDIQEKLFDLEVFSLNSEELVDVINRETFGLCSGVDLGNGPLVRLGLFKTEIGDHLLISVNHLIMDSYSLYILLQDFTAGYLQTINHIDIKFPETTHSFIDWARDLNKYAYSEMLLAQIPYWKNIEEIRNTPLKKDYSLDLHYYRNVRNVMFYLSKDETEKLKRQANYLYKTGIPELVLTALGLTLKEWLGENKILIHNMSNGREGLNGIDLTRTIGYFSFGHPFVLDMTESSDLPYTVRLTRDKLRKVPNQGMGYEILAYMTPPERTKYLKFTLKSDLLFNFFGQINNLALGELFTISPIPLINHWSPEVERGFSIYVEGAILDGQLIIKIEYDEVEFREETISQVVKDYEKHLRKMMA